LYYVYGGGGGYPAQIIGLGGFSPFFNYGAFGGFGLALFLSGGGFGTLKV